MANFKYKAKSLSGKEVEGVIQALDKESAVISLNGSDLQVTEIRKVDQIVVNLNNVILDRITDKDIYMVCRQFSIILSAGIPIGNAVRLVGNQTKNAKMKKILLEVSDDVLSGMSLADSFENRKEKLPTTFIETVRAGEASGHLEHSFERLAAYFHKRSSIADKVISALMYPSFVLVVAIIVVAVINVKAIPMFTESFSEMGIELPTATKIVIAVSDFTVNWGWFVLFILGLLYGAYLAYRNTEIGLYKTEKFKLRIPLIGKVIQMSNASEFANAFATMLSAGIPAVKALNIAGRSVTNKAISADILSACVMVESGTKIKDALMEKTELPEMLMEVTGIGEESASLEKTLTTISEYYDNEVELASARAVTIIEPTIICILAVVVVIVMLAVYTPMLSLYGSIA